MADDGLNIVSLFYNWYGIVVYLIMGVFFVKEIICSRGL
jgi:hypothetical protein